MISWWWFSSAVCWCVYTLLLLLLTTVARLKSCALIGLWRSTCHMRMTTSEYMWICFRGWCVRLRSCVSCVVLLYVVWQRRHQIRLLEISRTWMESGSLHAVERSLTVKMSLCIFTLCNKWVLWMEISYIYCFNLMLWQLTARLPNVHGGKTS